MYNFDSLLQRRGSDSTKWDSLKRDFGRDDLMPFWVADMDFPVLPEIVEALSKRSTEGQTFGYTFAGQDYFNSVIAWNKTRHGLDLEKDEIIPVPGVVTAIAALLLKVTKEEDKVVINPPVYTPFFQVIKDMNRQLVLSPLIQKDGKYIIDFADLEEKFRHGASLYLMCSPHNPVGRVWTKEELEQVTQLCRKYNVLLVSDEIHGDIVFSGHTHIPILNVCPEAIAISAPSKTFNIAGLKSSTILVKEPNIKKKVQEAIDCLHLYPNLFAYEATKAAYQYGAEWLKELNVYLEENARFTVEYLKEHLPQVVAYVPEGTYLMWLDFSVFGLSDQELESRMINIAQVALNSGMEYGKGYGQFMRLNIGAPRFYLEEGLKHIVDAFK